MRLVIAEQNHTGHYYNHVKLLLEAVAGLPVDVALLVTPQGADSPEFKTHLLPVAGALGSRVDVRTELKPRAGGMKRAALDSALNVRRAVKHGRPDVLWVPTGDGLAEAVGLAHLFQWRVVPGRVHAETLVTRWNFAYPEFTHRRSPERLVLAGLRRSPWRRIHLIDVVAYDWAKRHGGPLADRVDLIADPVEEFPRLTRAESRRRLGLPEGGRYLVTMGILVARKGIDRLLEAFRTADLRPDDRLLLAGAADAQVRAMIDRPEYKALRDAGRLLVVDRCLGADDWAAALMAADVQCCPYPVQPHPASIALKAMACERPVLGSDNYWLGRMVPRFGMGWTVPVNDPEAFSRMLRTALDEAPAWRRTEAARRLVEFLSVENFKATWTRGLREKLGLPTPPPRQTWEWVCEATNGDGGRDLAARGGGRMSAAVA